MTSAQYLLVAYDHPTHTTFDRHCAKRLRRVLRLCGLEPLQESLFGGEVSADAVEPLAERIAIEAANANALTIVRMPNRPLRHWRLATRTLPPPDNDSDGPVQLSLPLPEAPPQR